MPKNLQKSVQDYLSKFKKPTPQKQFPSNSRSSSTNWILSGCKHPKTPSFAVDHNQTQDQHRLDAAADDAATLSDVDRFLLEHFKSLYVQNDDVHDQNNRYNKTGTEESKESPRGSGVDGGAILFESPRFIDPPPDLCGSHRFFVTPCISSSLIEEARPSAATTSDGMGSSSSSTTVVHDSTTVSSEDLGKELSLPDDCIAVSTYSPNPYEDFRRSMQEMIEAHAKVDWDFMEELLFCYLNVNEKKSYKYILSAFADIIVILRRDSGETPASSQRVRSAGERRRRRRRRMRSNIT